MDLKSLYPLEGFPSPICLDGNQDILRFCFVILPFGDQEALLWAISGLVLVYTKHRKLF